MAWTFLPNTAQFFRFKNWCKITSRKKKFLDIGAVLRCAGGQIAIFFKKMHFSSRKGHFFKKFILYKNDQ